MGIVHFFRQERAGVATANVGTGDAPAMRGVYIAADAASGALDSLPKIHATAVAIEYTQDEAALAATVKRAHSLGLKAMVVPTAAFHVKNPYPQELGAVAAAARGAKADLLCVSWLNADAEAGYWEGQIAEVRKQFSGQVVLAATPEILPGVEFVEKVDLIGAIAPAELPLPKKHAARLEDVENAWASYLDSFESISERYGKKLVMIDAPQVGSAAKWDEAQEELRDEGLVMETKGRGGVTGVFLRKMAGLDGKFLERVGEMWITSKPAAVASAGTEDAGDEVPGTDQ
ncbi:MAG TPA: hypothetical protein VM008_11535 [Phycisphaerae bacterium]|nr:hypothetical protein [Phycisphaerae bacterium]